MRGPKIELEHQQYSETRTSVGSITRVWSGTRMIKGVLTKIPSRGSIEKYISGRDKEDILYSFLIKVPVGLTITNANRFIDRKTGRIFDIENPENVAERGTYLDIQLREIA